ncbi:glycosyltransferase family 39 protein [Arthrobacter sp. S39]|uniref:ArnT family glycosyltransferase n=1 Tax=Arthrobacter sp. S39 TaxID=2509720 RepID=UPI0013EFB86B|nr:glycosyltransferase family 39 protein [Arthrobacter sp. S39]
MTASPSTTLGNKGVKPHKNHNLGSTRTWEIGTLIGIISGSALIYVWGLAGNGWANAYYSAAVQAGQHDLAALFFGSADWGNSITVDKPPLSLWIMGLSVRIFGLNTWALLLPQAGMTMASTLLIYRVARPHLPASLALLSAAVFAMTPITVLLARYNNPDPLMVLLMLSALYAGIRAVETDRSRLLYLGACFLALGFLTKQLQAFLVLPAIVLVFLVYSSFAWPKRLVTLLFACVMLVAGSLAWPMVVELTPPMSRPYVGGSATNSMLELTLGYNGLDRVLKREADPSTALIPEAMRRLDTDAGFFRLFNANYGQEIGWLLVPALIASIAITVQLVSGRFSRKKSILATAAVSWLATTYIVLSFMGNSFHSYYTASLAAPLALCIGLGAELAFTSGRTVLSRVGLGLTVVASSIFSHAMWQLSDAYLEWLGNALLYAGLLSGAVLLLPAPQKWISVAASWLAIGSLLVGPLYCSVITLSSPQNGSNPLSGGVARNPHTLSRFLQGVRVQDPAWASGLAIGNSPSPAIAELLRSADADCTWAAATYPGQTAARFQLEVGRPIMPIGGFAATDPSPKLEQFQQAALTGRLCYLVEQPEQLMVPGNSSELAAIHDWVRNTFRAENIDGVTVYRLAL